MSEFKRATKASAKLRMALAGPAGSGKTYTGLSLATSIAQPVAVIDTERGSASKYADLFEFDVLELASFHPERYIEAIHDAEAAGYAALLIDSLSHAWMGKDGALEFVDRAAKRSQSSNSFAAWREVTPAHNAMVDAILAANMHVIVTMRSKQEYVQEKDDRGRTAIRKVGLAPVQRDGLEYEFDVYADLDQDNTLVVGKTRCPALSGAVVKKPGTPLAMTLLEWLGGAAPAEEQYVPTDTREVDDADIVRSADEQAWKSWQRIRKDALEFGVRFEELRLPMPRSDLRAYAEQVIGNIKERKAQLAKEDIEREVAV